MKIVIVIIIPRPGCYDCSAAPCPLRRVIACRFHYKSISSIKSSPKVSSLPQQYLSFLFFLLLLRTISKSAGARGGGAKTPRSGFLVEEYLLTSDDMAPLQLLKRAISVSGLRSSTVRAFSIQKYALSPEEKVIALQDLEAAGWKQVFLIMRF